MPRYPFGDRGAPTWYGIIVDTNFPLIDDPWYTFMENPPPNVHIFKQPGGLEYPTFDEAGNQIGGAENLNWLGQTEATRKLPFNHPDRLAAGRNYYLQLVQTLGEDNPWVRRYVYAEYGADPSGEAVFRATFNRSFHVVPRTEVVPGYTLVVGQDFGRNPWSLLSQLDHRGRLLIHKEIPAANCSIEKHVKENLIPVLMQPPFLGLPVFCVCDPAGGYGSQTTEETCVNIMQRMGLATFPAPTNEVDPRLRAVESWLVQQRSGGPAIVFSQEGCPRLIHAMHSSYRFQKKKTGILDIKPAKDNDDTHVVDDLQYICLVAHGGQVPLLAQYLNRPRTWPRREAVGPLGWT